MNTLIELHDRTIGGLNIPTVNARNLHAFLEVGTAFKDWIARRIADYDFVDGADFCSFLSETPSGGRPARDYYISLDMAKELSMVERNEQGKRARQYFIEMERQAKAAPIDPMRLLSDPAAMRGLLLTYTEKVMELEAQVTVLGAKGEALDRIATADGSLSITEASKALQMRPKDLFAWLQQNSWIYKRVGSASYLGYQTKTTAGLLEHKITTVLRADGSEKVTEQVRITPKGIARLAMMIKPALSAA